MIKKEKGITLVALIVTIVILLLTAGFILTVSLRNNIFTKPYENEETDTVQTGTTIENSNLSETNSNEIIK